MPGDNAVPAEFFQRVKWKAAAGAAYLPCGRMGRNLPAFSTCREKAPWYRGEAPGYVEGVLMDGEEPLQYIGRSLQYPGEALRYVGDVP